MMNLPFYHTHPLNHKMSLWMTSLKIYLVKLQMNMFQFNLVVLVINISLNLGPCGKAHCILGCVCDSLLTSRPPCGHFFCRDANRCTKHARARRHSLDSNLLDMRREQVEERRERKIENFVRENGVLKKRQVLRELYDTRCNLEDSKRENAVLRSKLTNQLEEIRFMKNIQRPRPVEPPPSSGSSICGKDGMPLSEGLLDEWATTFHKNNPCDFVARLIAEMFTEHYLATAPELQEGHIQAIICKISFFL